VAGLRQFNGLAFSKVVLAYHFLKRYASGQMVYRLRLRHSTWAINSSVKVWHRASVRSRSYESQVTPIKRATLGACIITWQLTPQKTSRPDRSDQSNHVLECVHCLHWCYVLPTFVCSSSGVSTVRLRWADIIHKAFCFHTLTTKWQSVGLLHGIAIKNFPLPIFHLDGEERLLSIFSPHPSAYVPPRIDHPTF